MAIRNNEVTKITSLEKGILKAPKKIVNTAINIKNNKEKFLNIGNLDDLRDWGSAEEYVEAMWLINNAEYPDEKVCIS